MQKAGRLYIVSTPIGNLSDMTFRAVEVLKSASLIAAEDTRKTGRLLKHFEIKTQMTSYHEHNEIEKAVKILDRLSSGEDVAVVSDAGTPSVSDPGYRLISSAVKAGFELIPIPGPSAAIAALSISGLPTDSFFFCGFLPDKKGKRITKLEEMKDVRQTLIFYVSKWKVTKTLEDILAVLGDRRACFCRELTKMHEEVLYGTIGELSAQLKDQTIKGEITLVVEGMKAE